MSFLSKTGQQRNAQAVFLRDGSPVARFGCWRTRNFQERFCGLLGLRRLEPSRGILIIPCGAVHTWFMRFPIDCVFLDRKNRVLKVVAGLRPWKWAVCAKAAAVFETAAGQALGIRPGDYLEEIVDPNTPKE